MLNPPSTIRIFIRALIRQCSRVFIRGMIFCSSIIFLYTLVLLLSIPRRLPRSPHPIIQVPISLSNDHSTCVNSRQGVHWIVDSYGNVCRRSRVLDNGCCSSNEARDGAYCLKGTSCCSTLEHCTSCCLASNSSSGFQQCLAACRTSKKVTIHGNRYKSVFRHCFASVDLDLNKSKELVEVVVAENPGDNCDHACMDRGKVCVPQFLNVESCTNVLDLFSCSSGCSYDSRADRPSIDLISQQKIGGKFAGKCVLPKKDVEMDCDASHPASIRVCTCVEKPKI